MQKITAINVPDSVESIGQSAFSGCSMRNVTIPKTVKSIGVHAFGWIDGGMIWNFKVRGCNFTAAKPRFFLRPIHNSTFCNSPFLRCEWLSKKQLRILPKYDILREANANLEFFEER